MNGMIDCNEMITKVFRNIEAGDVENARNISSVWNKVVRSIKNNRDELYGEKIASHSEVVDIKNGQLLIETDHPGWNQAIQMYSKYIIKGFKMNAPELKVDSLVFRLKGSGTILYTSYEEELEKASRKFDEKMTESEKQMNSFYEKSGASGAKQEQEKPDLPPDFLARLKSLEESVLTNSKN